MFKKIGFIGTGFVGGNLFKNFCERKEEIGAQEIIPYSLDEKYIRNKQFIDGCDLVFVAVPTPTDKQKFNDSCLIEAISNTGKSAVVVIKSTIPPGYAYKYQKMYPDKTIIHCPEFLTESTAKHDTDNPDRNIIGIFDDKDENLHNIASELAKILPKAKETFICRYDEAAMVKYAGNCFFYFKNIFFNLLYDLVSKTDSRWDYVRDMILADTRINPVHTKIFHKGGRGAGNKCLIKDMAIFSQLFKKFVNNEFGNEILRNLELRNINYLTLYEKDLQEIKNVYGEEIYGYKTK